MADKVLENKWDYYIALKRSYVDVIWDLIDLDIKEHVRLANEILQINGKEVLFNYFHDLKYFGYGDERKERITKVSKEFYSMLFEMALSSEEWASHSRGYLVDLVICNREYYECVTKDCDRLIIQYVSKEGADRTGYMGVLLEEINSEISRALCYNSKRIEDVGAKDVSGKKEGYLDIRDRFSQAVLGVHRLSAQQQFYLSRLEQNGLVHRYFFEYFDDINAFGKGDILPLRLELLEESLHVLMSYALYPCEWAGYACTLLEELVRYDQRFIPTITTECIKVLEKAVKESDYEITMLVGVLLRSIESPYYQNFLDLCKNSDDSEINSVLEIFED